MKQGLKKKDTARSLDEYFALFDANGILLEQNGKYCGVFDKLRLVRHFGLFQLRAFFNWITNLTNDFAK